MNKLFLFLISLLLIGRPCLNQKAGNPIKEITIDSIVYKLFSEFSQNLEGSSFKNADRQFLIDSIILDDKIAEEFIKSIFFKDFQNSDLIDLNVNPHKDLIVKTISHYFPETYKSFCDDRIIKMNLFERNTMLKNEKAMLIKYSKFYKLTDQDIYFFSFHYFCGKLCAGQYFIRFELDTSGNIKDHVVSFSES
jgi:hypothetical protein